MQFEEERDTLTPFTRHPDDLLLERTVLGLLGALILLLAMPAFLMIPTTSVGPNPDRLALESEDFGKEPLNLLVPLIPEEEMMCRGSASS